MSRVVNPSNLRVRHFSSISRMRTHKHGGVKSPLCAQGHTAGPWGAGSQPGDLCCSLPADFPFSSAPPVCPPGRTSAARESGLVRFVRCWGLDPGTAGCGEGSRGLAQLNHVARTNQGASRAPASTLQNRGGRYQSDGRIPRQGGSARPSPGWRAAQMLPRLSAGWPQSLAVCRVLGLRPAAQAPTHV